MTSWPEPERPVLRARPPKAFRDDKDEERRRRFTRDDRWVLAGLALAAGLLFGYVGYWTNWFGLTAPPAPPPDASTPAPSGVTTGGLVVLGLFGLFVVAVVVWILRGLRDDAPRLDELPEAEQQRRREAAALLREVEPPVDEAEAAAQLRPDWLDDAIQRAAERSSGVTDGP